MSKQGCTAEKCEGCFDIGSIVEHAYTFIHSPDISTRKAITLRPNRYRFPVREKSRCLAGSVRYKPMHSRGSAGVVTYCTYALPFSRLFWEAMNNGERALPTYRRSRLRTSKCVAVNWLFREAWVYTAREAAAQCRAKLSLRRSQLPRRA